MNLKSARYGLEYLALFFRLGHTLFDAFVI